MKCDSMSDTIHDVFIEDENGVSHFFFVARKSKANGSNF